MTQNNNNTQVVDMTDAERQELIALRAENAKLKNKAVGGMKVSEKGAVSVYGLGRFPVTLYAAQWEKLIAMTGDIQAFIEANKARLTYKQAKGNDENVEVA